MKVTILSQTCLAQPLIGVANDGVKLAEYAGRLCYNSINRMGTTPHFVQARIAEGHEDVIEHARYTVKVVFNHDDLMTIPPNSFPDMWHKVTPYLETTLLHFGKYIVTGNARAWLQLFRAGMGKEVMFALRDIAPEFFGEIA